RIAGGAPRPADLKRLAESLLDLGESGEAVGLLLGHPTEIESGDLLRIHSDAALLEGDYFRAAEILKPLRPTGRLAFAAQRSGDWMLACRSLEQVCAAQPTPETRSALHRLYHRLVLEDLEPGSSKLVGETIVRFGQTT